MSLELDSDAASDGCPFQLASLASIRIVEVSPHADAEETHSCHNSGDAPDHDAYAYLGGQLGAVARVAFFSSRAVRGWRALWRGQRRGFFSFSFHCRPTSRGALSLVVFVIPYLMLTANPRWFDAETSQRAIHSFSCGDNHFIAVSRKYFRRSFVCMPTSTSYLWHVSSDVCPGR